MESRFCSSWIYFWMCIILFRRISADPASPPRYIVHHTPGSFDQAMTNCSPGVLTTLATKQEVTNILGLISKSASPPNPNEFTFWVGLRKVKNECVVPMLPLRGFKWMEDGSKESQVSHWTEEPKPTCTAVLCAALKGELDGSVVTTWGLIPVTCKTRYQFICKLRDRPSGETSENREAGDKPANPEPTTPEAKPATPEQPNPAMHQRPQPEPRPPTRKPEPITHEPKIPTQRPEPGNDQNPKTGPELQGADPEQAPGLDSCQRPLIPGARFLTLDPDNSSRIQVDCWSTIQVELHCLGRPTVWRLLDNSPANFTTVCQPCEDGFQKNTSAKCVDIDECGGGAPCRHICLNTEGSYRCVCSDENGKHHDEDSAACTNTVTNGDSGMLSGLLIPVLVAVVVLVVLVVVVGVTVKCCLIRRSRKRAIKKAENMVMKSKDGKESFETAKEKVAT